MKVNQLIPLRFGLLCLAAVLSGCTTPTNLYVHKQELIRYHDLGRYEAQVQHVAGRALGYIRKRAASGEQNLAVVLDIDDTAISTWGRLIQDDFARKDEMFVRWVGAHNDPPIDPILDLYRQSKELDLKVFFITGRRPPLRERTEQILTAAGYADHDGVFFRPETDKHKSIVPFKSGARKEIIGRGFKIVANIGDQHSDLAGGYAERTFKVPNPFYYTQ